MTPIVSVICMAFVVHFAIAKLTLFRALWVWNCGPCPAIFSSTT